MDMVYRKCDYALSVLGKVFVGLTQMLPNWNSPKSFRLWPFLSTSRRSLGAGSPAPPNCLEPAIS